MVRNNNPGFPQALPTAPRPRHSWWKPSAVIWTKPEDIPFSLKKPLPKLGGMFDGRFNVCLGDGSVMQIKKNIDEKEMKKLITPAGGEVFDLDDFKQMTDSR